MKKKYITKSLLSLILFISFLITAKAQIRFVEVNTANNTAIIKNFGGSTINISTYQLCDFPTYPVLNTLSVISGSLNLSSGSEVEIDFSSAITLNTTDGELGLYINGPFGTASNMRDYIQWGSSPHTRENVANTAGIWTSGDFISVASPYEYTGNGTSENGESFWGSVLGIEDIEKNISFNISPNPVTSNLNIQLSNSLTNGNIKVFDILGKQILTKEFNSNNLTQLNVSNLSKGMYLVKVSSGENIQTKRFIKQ